MSTWLHGWIEVRNGPDASWSPFLKTDRLLGLSRWWRIPLFGRSKLIDGYFEPVPFVNGVPDDLSDAVRFDVAGRPTDDGSYAIDPLQDSFWDPRRDVQYVTYAELETIDWDVPRNDILPALAEFEDWALENELLLNAYEFELRDDAGQILHERVGNISNEIMLATIGRKTECGDDFLDRCHTKVPEHLLEGQGPVRWEGGYLHAVRPIRRDFLPDGWFGMLDLIDHLTASPSVSGEDVRLFCYFTH